MSSENLQHEDNSQFKWTGNTGDREDYVLATYIINTPVTGEQAAYGIAREQSICATSLDAIQMPSDLDSYCAKVMSIEPLAGSVSGPASLYYLNTPVYGNNLPDESQHKYRIVIAYPIKLFGPSLTRLWNSVFGEVHRLGYLSAAVLTDLQFPDAYMQEFAGAKFGITGIREKLGIKTRPVYCRSMRPAAGLDTAAMLELNRLVLAGGFDVIKDDELTYDSPRSPFVQRIRAMVDMKAEIEDRSGESKLYFANIITDYPDALEMADQAVEAGVDGLMVSVGAQGFSIISEVSQRTGLMVLAHNSCSDVFTRAPDWGASDAVLAKIQRLAGADLIVSPGAFATPYQDPELARAFLDACSTENISARAVLPIIQGGKQPQYLQDYISAAGSANFMIIAATWLDHHPHGMQQGALAFRQAWSELNRDGM